MSFERSNYRKKCFSCCFFPLSIRDRLFVHVEREKFMSPSSVLFSLRVFRSEKKLLNQMTDLLKKKHQLRLIELEESVLLSQVIHNCSS